MWCTEREGRIIDFWVAFSNAIIIVGSSSESLDTISLGESTFPSTMTFWRKPLVVILAQQLV